MPGGATAVRSHGPAIHGYGPVKFGMTQQVAYQALQGRAQFQPIPGSQQNALTYMDYIDYFLVRVVQFFDENKAASKAEVYVEDAQRTARTLNECRSVHFTVYNMLQKRYGQLDWEPRTESRRYGESGVLMYTFADSSNIMLNYDYVTQDTSSVGLCTVKLTFSPPWA